MGLFDFLRGDNDPIVAPVPTQRDGYDPFANVYNDATFGVATRGEYGNPARRNVVTPEAYANDPVTQRTQVEQERVRRQPTVVPQYTRDAGIRPYQYDSTDLINSLEMQRQDMLNRRNAAIRAAGRGAGAGYSAAIARLDDEISKLREQMPRVSGVFDQKIQNQYDIYDRAGQELTTSYDDALLEERGITLNTQENIRQHFTQAQDRAAGIVDKIGGDEATANAVAQEVGRFENAIIEMDEINSQGVRGIMQAAENLASKSAIATGATNALDMKRRQIQMEADMKEQLADMIAQRDQQIKARNAAVSAARQLEAARWPENVPPTRSGFAELAQSTYADSVGMSEANAAFAGQLESYGFTGEELRKIRAGVRGQGPNGEWIFGRQAQEILDRRGASFATLPQNQIDALNAVATVFEVGEQAAQQYDERYTNGNPLAFPQDSAERAMAGTAWAENRGHSERDSIYIGREIAEADDARARQIMGFSEDTFDAVEWSRNLQVAD